MRRTITNSIDYILNDVENPMMVREVQWMVRYYPAKVYGVSFHTRNLGTISLDPSKVRTNQAFYQIGGKNFSKLSHFRGPHDNQYDVQLSTAAKK